MGMYNSHLKGILYAHLIIFDGEWIFCWIAAFSINDFTAVSGIKCIHTFFSGGLKVLDSHSLKFPSLELSHTLLWLFPHSA